MGASGANANTPTPVSIDPGSLSEFMQSSQGKAFAGQYNPANSYSSANGNYYSSPTSRPNALNDPLPAPLANPLLSTFSGSGNNVTGMITAYQSWLAGQNQAAANWTNYSQAVAANEGGEGDNTITTGAAVGQRQQLLGALANAGNPTAPTPGVGVLGAVQTQLGAIK